MPDTSDPQKVQLEYFNATANRGVFPPAVRELSYRVALGCWFVPLALGLCNFGLWYVLRWQFLKTLGTAIIVAGFGAGAFSLVCAGYFALMRLRAGARIWREALGPAVVLFVLLVLSFILTIACSSVAFSL